MRISSGGVLPNVQSSSLNLQTPLIATTSVTPSLGGPLLATTSSSAPVSLGSGLMTTSTAPVFKFKPLSSTTSSGDFGTTTASGGGLGATAGFANSTQPSTGFNFGTVAATNASVSGFSAQPVATVTTSKTIGLGGIDVNASAASNKDGGDASGKSNGKSAKSTDVPNQILSAVESFKKYVKEQKAVTEELSRVSSKPMNKVEEETTGLNQLVSVISNGINRNSTFVSKLKQESARELKNAEIAKQTKDLPAGMQYENTVPIAYFQRMVVEFERQMSSYKQQIEELEHHLMSLNHSSPVNPNELTMMVKRIHETFVALAAQLHSINEGVNVQKEQFLRYRKTTLGDSRDVFAERLKGINSTQSRSEGSVGPSAFSDIPNVAAVAMVSALNRSQQTPVANPPTIGLGAPSGSFGSNLPAATSTSLFGNLQSGSLFSQNKGFGTTSSGLTFPTGAKTPGSTNQSFGISQPTSGFGSGFSLGNTSAVRPLGSNTGASLSAGPFMGSSGSLSVNPVLPVQNDPFVLQNPPLGTKRGKRLASSS